SLKTFSTLLTPRNWGHLGRVLKRIKAVIAYTKGQSSSTTGWTGKWYFSAGPFALGDGAMKLCLKPQQAHPIEAIDACGEPTQRARAALQTWIAAGKDARFDLCVQLATPDCIPSPGPGDPPKRVMVAEYCDLEWDESKSPYVRVGTLTHPATT